MFTTDGLYCIQYPYIKQLYYPKCLYSSGIYFDPKVLLQGQSIYDPDKGQGLRIRKIQGPWHRPRWEEDATAQGLRSTRLGTLNRIPT